MPTLPEYQFLFFFQEEEAGKQGRYDGRGGYILRAAGHARDMVNVVRDGLDVRTVWVRRHESGIKVDLRPNVSAPHSVADVCVPSRPRRAAPRWSRHAGAPRPARSGGYRAARGRKSGSISRVREIS